MPTRHCESTAKKEEEFEVEGILDIRTINGEPEYLIKWKGHSPSKNTWEPQSNLNCPVLLRRFLDKHAATEPTIATIPEGVEPYGFDRGLAPDFIDMVTKKDNELYFLIKCQVRDVVPAAQANIRCPQIVIKFYESILHFT
ncbi:Chromobox protein 3 isoform 2 [Schistosoma japonicum]|uniref:Chromobox protein 3 isoform 2 n=1 Tax=Schistosoma japonicum TaxID=6182 RepID=Q5D8Y6_SCHJA|nr:unknown [Schistosoma japonicum]KAH8877504.1 Chromobox protein like [Schistosoma japonicum]TNN15659.1 Chromobox protein 3 isoform 2 [Schistosoma japonicum]